MYVTTLPRTTGKVIDTYVQNQFTDMLFLPFHRHTGNTFTLTVAAAPGDWTITVSAGHSLTVGDPITTLTDDEYWYGYVVGIATNVITLDRIITFAMDVGTEWEELAEEMAIDADPTRVAFHTYSVPNHDFDITGMNIGMICATTPDDSLFGDLPALTKGISLRKFDGLTGKYTNLGTARTNGHMALFVGGGQVIYTDKAGGGEYGVRVNANWVTGWGVSIRLRGSTAGTWTLNGRDELVMVIQDDIDGLTSMGIIAIGHIVEY